MQELTLILMHRDIETGHLDRELCTVTIPENGGLISNIYVTGKEDPKHVHMVVTTEEDVLDWEFQAVFDYYDTEIYEGQASVSEFEGEANPAWEIVFSYADDASVLTDKITRLLKLHKEELDSVKEAIKGLEGDYNAL